MTNSMWICAAVFSIATLVDAPVSAEAQPKATGGSATNPAKVSATLRAAAPATVGFDQNRLALLNSAMHRKVDTGEIAGIMTMLVRHGKIVSYDAYGKDSISKNTPLRRDTLFRIFSQTKPVTGVAMMILYEEGKWQLDDPISKYIPEFAQLKVFAGLDNDGKPMLDEVKQPPTMAMLMTHTAGFGYGLENVNYVDDVDQQFQYLQVLRSNSVDEAVMKIASIPLLYQPGTRWWYSAAADIQGYIVEKLSGQRLGDFLAQRVFAPLGMKDTGFFIAADKAVRLASIYQLDPTNNKLIELKPSANPGGNDFTKKPPMDLGGGGDGAGGGGLVTTIDDYARFCQMILNGGTYNGVRILAPQTIASMQADHIPSTVIPDASGGFPAFGGPALGFGLGFGVVKNPALFGMSAGHGNIFWGGGAGTWFWIDPKNDQFFLGMMQLKGADATELNIMSQTLAYAALTRPDK